MKQTILDTFQLGDHWGSVPSPTSDRFMRGVAGILAVPTAALFTAAMITGPISFGVDDPTGWGFFVGGLIALYCLVLSWLWFYRGVKGYERVYIGPAGFSAIQEQMVTVEEAVLLGEAHQKELDRESQKQSVQRWNSTIPVIQGILACIGLGVLVYQCFGFLQSGTWPGMPLDYYGHMMPGKIGDWYSHPESWLGLHAIIQWVFAKIGVSAAFWLVAWGMGAAYEEAEK